MDTNIKPLRVFVCSPLRAPTSEGYARNLQVARELTRAVLLAGHAPYCPHLWYSTHLDDTREDQRKLGMAAGAAWLRVADEIWVYAIDESECSSGMRAEVEAAQRFALPVRVVWMPECFAEVKARHLADAVRREPTDEERTRMMHDNIDDVIDRAERIDDVIKKAVEDGEL